MSDNLPSDSFCLAIFIRTSWSKWNEGEWAASTHLSMQTHIRTLTTRKMDFIFRTSSFEPEKTCVMDFNGMYSSKERRQRISLSRWSWGEKRKNKKKEEEEEASYLVSMTQSKSASECWNGSLFIVCYRYEICVVRWLLVRHIETVIMRHTSHWYAPCIHCVLLFGFVIQP